jgi:hypothetical protein
MIHKGTDSTGLISTVGDLAPKINGRGHQRGSADLRGFVICDHDDHAILAGSCSLKAVHDADCAKALVLQAALNHGMERIILEDDSMNTVQAL